MKNTKLLLIFALTGGFTVATEEFKHNSDSTEEIIKRIKRIKTPTNDPASFSDRQIIEELQLLNLYKETFEILEEQDELGMGYERINETALRSNNLFRMLVKNCKKNNTNLSEQDSSCEQYYAVMQEAILKSEDIKKAMSLAKNFDLQSDENKIEIIRDIISLLSKEA